MDARLSQTQRLVQFGREALDFALGLCLGFFKHVLALQREQPERQQHQQANGQHRQHEQRHRRGVDDTRQQVLGRGRVARRQASHGERGEHQEADAAAEVAAVDRHADVCAQ